MVPDRAGAGSANNDGGGNRTGRKLCSGDAHADRQVAAPTEQQARVQRVAPRHLRHRAARRVDLGKDRQLLLPPPPPPRAGNHLKSRGSPVSRHSAVLSPTVISRSHSPLSIPQAQGGLPRMRTTYGDAARSGAGSPRCASRRPGTRRDHATQAPSYPRHPFSSGIFASAMVAAVPAVLGSYLRCCLFGLAVEVGGSPPWRSQARGAYRRERAPA